MEKAQKYSDVELGYLPSLPLGKAFIYNMSHPRQEAPVLAVTCGKLNHRTNFQQWINKVVFPFPPTHPIY